MARFLAYIFGLAALLFLQEYVFSAINILGVVSIFAYVMIIIMLPLNFSRVWLLIIAFGIGYLMDTVMGSNGLNAICLVWIAFARGTVAELTMSRDVVMSGLVPSSYRAGAQGFIMYVLLMCFLFAVPYFLLEMMSFVGLWTTVIRIVASTVITSTLIYLFHLPFNK
ncbi:MAG: hypothetical protein RSF93_05250 [Mucinivorans sp.]